MGVIKLAAVSKIEGLNLITDDTGDVDVKEVNNRCFCFLNRAAAPGCRRLCLGAKTLLVYAQSPASADVLFLKGISR